MPWRPTTILTGVLKKTVLSAFFYYSINCPAQELKPLHYVSYNVNEGLLQSQVNAIEQDGSGFVWISLGSDLQRFDGNRFDRPTLFVDSGNTFSGTQLKFYRLQNGNLWISCQNRIVEYNRFKNRLNSVVQFYKQAATLTPLCYTEDEETIWCWWPNRGFYRLSKTSFRFTDSVLVTNFLDTADSLKFYGGNAYSTQNFLVLQTPTQLLLVNKKTRLISHFKAKGRQNLFFTSVPYKADTVLVATQKGIGLANLASGSYKELCDYKSNPVSVNPLHPVQLKLISNETCLVSEANRLFELDLLTGSYRFELVDRQNKPLVEVGYITALFQDKHKNLWLLTENDGIRKVYYRDEGFRYFGTGERKKNFTRSIYVDKTDNRVLCGSFGNGMMIFDTAGRLLKTINQFAEADPPYTVCAFKKMAPHRYLLVLMGTWNSYIVHTRNFSVQLFSRGENFITKEKINSHSPDYHFTLHTIDDQNAIAQSGYFIYRLNSQPTARVNWQYLDSLPDASVSSYLDRQNRLWIGSYEKFFVSEPGRFDAYKEHALPGNKVVRCFFDDGKGSVWIGAQKGLYQANKKGQIKRKWGLRDGLIDESIYAIRGDRQGNIWFTHNKGISCLRTDQSLLHFNKNDGLQENEFNTNTCFEAADGELYFGGVNGVSSFYPDRIRQANEEPEVFLTSLFVNDENIISDTASWLLNSIELPYYKNVFSFGLTAIGSRSADQYNYQYQLADQKTAWVNAGNNSQLRLVLQPGRYLFRYYAGNSFYENPAAAKELIIIINPPFWQTTWFIILCLTVLTTLIIAVTRSVARRKLKLQIAELERNKALNEERLRISREMHDDIGAGLTQITLMSEAAKNPEKGVKPIEEIAGTSRKLISSINEIIWSLHPENQSLEQLLAYLREQLHQLLEYSGIEYSIGFPENGRHILLSNAQRRNLLLVTKEIVHNAVKHSKAKHIEVVCRINKSGIAFTISDDGIGIPVSSKGSGNGLRNIRKRIEELNGELLVQSEKGSGSRFFYTIPVSV